jgi:general secretion pathway protein J
MPRSAEHGFTSASRSAEHGFTSASRSAEHGFTSASRSAQQGFTLIELMVAVMIFAMIATTGVLLLRGSVDSQNAVRGHLDSLGSLQRAISTLDADLAQASTRISRTQAGTLAPAFYGRAAQHDEPLMQFVRGGWSNPGNLRRSTLQKIEYWWRDGKIERVSYPYVDGAAPADPAPLAEGVTSLTIRYRARTGDWLEVWSPETPDDMPLAVEWTLTRGKGKPLVLRFLVGAQAGQVPLPEEPQGAPPGPGQVGNGV